MKVPFLLLSRGGLKLYRVGPGVFLCFKFSSLRLIEASVPFDEGGAVAVLMVGFPWAVLAQISVDGPSAVVG